jgi:hypothetical protein
MSLPKHLEAAAKRLEDASFQIEAARAKPPTLESLRDWLAALTDQVQALSDIQRLNNESIHEKLHAIAGPLGIERVLYVAPRS